MSQEIVEISSINFLRWVYEASMVWKFDTYHDGEYYLSTYEFSNFKKDHIFEIIANFFIFDICVFFLALYPIPNTLKRVQVKTTPTNRDSTASGVFNLSVDYTNAPEKPSVFQHQTSISAATFLPESSASKGSMSPSGKKDAYRGPTITFSDLSYFVKDSKAPLGEKTVLHKMTGRCDWGKLTAIMGAQDSGKSSLLQLLGGEETPLRSRVVGDILYDAKEIDNSIPPWQKSAYVECLDTQFRDLSVRNCVWYAMALRCMNSNDRKMIPINVNRTLDLLSLTE
jgi:hypothetical protein